MAQYSQFHLSSLIYSCTQALSIGFLKTIFMLHQYSLPTVILLSNPFCLCSGHESTTTNKQWSKLMYISYHKMEDFQKTSFSFPHLIMRQYKNKIKFEGWLILKLELSFWFEFDLKLNWMVKYGLLTNGLVCLICALPGLFGSATMLPRYGLLKPDAVFLPFGGSPPFIIILPCVGISSCW